MYLARDAKHDRRVAIKVIHSELTARLGAQRFVQEIRVTARLQHPHVVALLDSGVFDGDAGALAGRPYYVMPYVEGESLRDRLVREGAFRVPEAVRLLREVADALSYAHEQGVVHRDVKPENILLSRGHAIVADFGIAKAIAAAGDANRPEGERATIRSDGDRELRTEASSLLGTRAYMAPEQDVPETRIDHRADLYAWGVVAYEVLTGRRPFNADSNARELVAAQATAAPRPIGELTPGLPPAVVALVTRCLARAPDHRPASAAAIVSALDAATKLPPRFRLRRTWLGAAAVGVALAAAMVVYWRSGRVVPRRVVIGTGNAAIDVAAVQFAVDHADTVVLEGRLSFNVPAAKRIAASYASGPGTLPPASEVRVSRAVTISGTQNAHHDRTTIEGGTIPFYVDTPGQHVAIRGLHFVRPTGTAILVHAVDGLEIASVKIDSVAPFAHCEAIAIMTSAELPSPNEPGTPEAITGSLSIQNDTIDASGGTPQDYRGGIAVWGVGQSPRHEVTLEIAGNEIHNTSGSAIIVRRASGRVLVNANSIVTSVDGAVSGVVAIRLANNAAYVMANNVVECRWAKCVGIAVFSQHSEWPLAHAIVEDNVVTMAPPPGTVFGDSSAAIEVRGFVDSSVVRRNTLRGRARAAFVVRGFNGGIPLGNAFIDNRMDDFHASLADVVVKSGVVGTRLVRPRTVIDQGERTIIDR